MGAGSPPPSTCLGCLELSWKLPATSPVAGPNWQKVHCHPNSTKTHAPTHTTCGPRGPGLGCALAVGPAPRAVGGPGVHAWGPLGRPQWPAACPLAPKPQKWRHHGKGAPQHKHRPPPVGAFAPWLIGAARNGPFSSFGMQPAAAPAVFWKFPRNSPKTLAGQIAPQWGKAAQI